MDDERLRWLARGMADVPDGDAWMAPGEAARAARMRFTKRRTEYRLRRWAGKHALAAALGLPADDPAGLARVEVRNAWDGAPEAFVDGRPAGLRVSLTDRAGWAVCVVHAAGEVGCDLELVEPRTDGFVRDFLTAAEQRMVGGLPAGEPRHEAANLLWSAKESALKVLRTGLRRDTRSVDVDLGPGGDPGAGLVGTPDGGPDGWAPLVVRPAEGGELPGWWRRAGVFLLTVAAPGPRPAPVALEPADPLARAEPVEVWMSSPLAP